MKQVCLHCDRQAPAGSLWCQEAFCAADDKPLLFEPGEILGEITVDRVVTVMKTGVVYAAERQQQPVLVKVAHSGHQERLKREAVFLAELQRRVKGDASPHPALPALLPAYTRAELTAYPYGKTVVNGTTFYYMVFRHAAGEPLRQVLYYNSQPWYQNAGWLVLAVADAVALMHAAGQLHLCLSPECILVRFDRDGLPRPLLLDLGAITPPDGLERNWQRSFTPPPYLAPELLSQTGARVGAFSDVYGLGLLLYEMLAGKSPFSANLSSIGKIYTAILNDQPEPLERPDLRNLPEIAGRAISKDPRRRPQHVIAFARELQANLPPLPREKRERRVNWRVVAISLSAAMAIALLLALALSLAVPTV